MRSWLLLDPWSGFQPTVEPTAFQAVIIQYRTFRPPSWPSVSGVVRLPEDPWFGVGQRIDDDERRRPDLPGADLESKPALRARTGRPGRPGLGATDPSRTTACASSPARPPGAWSVRPRRAVP